MHDVQFGRTGLSIKVLSRFIQIMILRNFFASLQTDIVWFSVINVIIMMYEYYKYLCIGSKT
jgi:hypothetical protein